MLLSTLKSTIFRIINQQPKCCAIFFAKINPDISTFTLFFTRGVRGSIAPPPPKAKEMEKMETFPFLHEILHPRRVYTPVMMWIQIYTRREGGPGVCPPPPPIFLIEMVQSCGISECPKITILRIIFHNSKKYSPYLSPLTNTKSDWHVSTKVNTFRLSRGGVWGASPQRPKILLNKSNGMKAFPSR